MSTMLKKLNNLQIRDRLTRAFITVACILTLVSAVILITMIIISRVYAATVVDYGFAQGDIGRAMAQFADTRSAMRGIIGYDDQDAIDTLLILSHTKKALQRSLTALNRRWLQQKTRSYTMT